MHYPVPDTMRVVANDYEDDLATEIYFKIPAAPSGNVYSDVQHRALAQRFSVPTLARPMSRPHIDKTSMINIPRTRTLVGIGFAAMCVLVGITLGTLIAFSDRSTSTAAAASLDDPQARVVAPVVTPPGRVTVRVDSQPSGATAMIVEHGKTTLVGKTPVDVEIEPARAYDLILTLEHHVSHVEHLDSTTSHRVLAILTPSEPAPQPVVAAPAPVVIAPVVVAPAPQPVVAAPAPVAIAPVVVAPAPVVHHRAAKQAPREEVTVVKPAVATGTLVVSSKPPCSIRIDGKSTGLTTPQRSIALSAGSHDVELINAEEGIHLTTAVEISADHPTQLIQDFTK